MDIEKLKAIHKKHKNIHNSVSYCMVQELEEAFPELNEKRTTFNWDYNDEDPPRIFNGELCKYDKGTSPQYKIKCEGSYYLSIGSLKEMVEVLQNAVEVMEE